MSALWVLVQVLDDSTDHMTRQLVDDKCLEWVERGVACECVRRTHRQGYKAGALKEVRHSLLQKVQDASAATCACHVLSGCSCDTEQFSSHGVHVVAFRGFLSSSNTQTSNIHVERCL